MNDLTASTLLSLYVAGFVLFVIGLISLIPEGKPRSIITIVAGFMMCVLAVFTLLNLAG